MCKDPIVNEVKKIRKQLESEFDFNSKLIFKSIRERQALLGSRLVNRKKVIAPTVEFSKQEECYQVNI